MAKLVLLQGGEALPYELSRESTTLGRLPECDIQLQSNMVSRNHARVTIQGDDVLIEDLGSGNGSYVNGKRITEPTTLTHGDRIKLGPILLRFEVDNPPVELETSSSGILQTTPIGGVEITRDDSHSTIMGAVDNAEGFGLLDVQPQAKLKAVLEISRSLAGTLDMQTMLPRILDTLFDVFPHADRGCILLRDDDSGEMIPRAVKHRRSDKDDSVKLSRTILNQVLENKKAILSADAASDERFQASESISALTIRSMMCAPMLSLSGEPMGIINIDTQNPISQFRKDDLDIMIAVAGQAALSFESARLLASYVEKQKQDSEMQIARNVQRSLLPEQMPDDIPGYQFFASYEAAQAVGGDYYDVIPLSDGVICLAFGDVAGKGVPASLVMSRLSSVVRSTVEFVRDADQAVARINDHMCAKAIEGRFVTFVYIMLDTKNHRMSVVNAGHMSPMIRLPDGSIEEFPEDSVGIPLGVMEGFPFEMVERTIEPGETIVIYTDGVSEAMNFENELYGLPRLRDFVKESTPEVGALGSAIREDVARHANGRPQNDDITLMVFGRDPA
ncbi:MAG: SpoIIE family protein phosphatase [Maioricimonas sp. JB045]